MNTIFINSENSKISDSHRLLLSILICMLLYQILACTIHEKI